MQDPTHGQSVHIAFLRKPYLAPESKLIGSRLQRADNVGGEFGAAPPIMKTKFAVEDNVEHPNAKAAR